MAYFLVAHTLLLLMLSINLLSSELQQCFGCRLVEDTKVVNIDVFGDNSQGFEKAWKEACSSSTSSVLMVPKNKNYTVEPIAFAGPCTSQVTVMIMGTLEAPEDRTKWTDESRWITFTDVDNLVVQGGGILNGNGKIWWQNSCKINKSARCTNAPTALTFEYCNHLRVGNLEILNSQQIHVSFWKCSNVDVSHLSINSPGTSPNTDGIHVTATQGITISDSNIKSGDDCISIVSGSSDVMATNIVCGPGHGISIGSLGADHSEARVYNVTVDTARLVGTANGVRIKTWQGGKGYAKSIKFKNIIMQNVLNPIIIDQNYCDSTKPCYKHQQGSAVEVGDVLYKNITGTSASENAINFSCSEAVACQGIVLQDINLVDGGSTRSSCENAEWSRLGSVVPSPCAN